MLSDEQWGKAMYDLGVSESEVNSPVQYAGSEAWDILEKDRAESRELLRRCVRMVQMDIMEVDDDERVELVEDAQAHLGEGGE